MVFGTGNNGKSTLLNALLGEYLLPSDEVVCTGNTTAIKRVQNAGGEEIALLQYGDTTVQEELGPASSRTEPRIKKDWVMDMDISEIQVQHAHGMFCDHGVTIMDVPGCVKPLASYHLLCTVALAPVKIKFGFCAQAGSR